MPPLRPDTWSGLLIGVAGGSGAGSSLLAMCLAADLASDASNRGLVLLADIAAAGVGEPPAHDLPDTVARVRVSGEHELEGLLGAHRFVVADFEASIAEVVATERAATERATATERAGDSERMGLTEATLRRSDLIVVVGAGDPKSLHSLVQHIEALARLVGADRILPVVNRLPRSFKRRSAAVAETFRLLASSPAFEAGDPVLIAENEAIRRAARDGLTPPLPLVRPLASEVRLRLATASRNTDTAVPPVPFAVAGD